MNERELSSAMARAESSPVARASLILGLAVEKLARRLDPAHRMQAAAVAGQRRFARRDGGMAVRNLGCQHAQSPPPPGLERGPVTAGCDIGDCGEARPVCSVGGKTDGADRAGLQLAVGNHAYGQ